MEGVHPFGLFPARVIDREAITHADAFDHEHVVLGLDLADRLDLVALRIDFDLTRFQRARERASQSPASRRDDVVERGRVRRIAVRIHAVVLGDLGMHAKHNRFGLRGQMREPLRSAEPFDPHAGDIGDLAHGTALYSGPRPTAPPRQTATTAFDPTPRRSYSARWSFAG